MMLTAAIFSCALLILALGLNEFMYRAVYRSDKLRLTIVLLVGLLAICSFAGSLFAPRFAIIAIRVFVFVLPVVALLYFFLFLGGATSLRRASGSKK